MLNTSELVKDIYDVMTSLVTFSVRKEDATSGKRRRVLVDQDAMDNSTNVTNTDVGNDSSASNSTETVERINVTEVFEVY